MKKTEEWFPVRCKYYSDLYSYNKNGKIRNKTKKILKFLGDKKQRINLSRTIDGIPYKRVFQVDRLLNTDDYLDEVGFEVGKAKKPFKQRESDRFKPQQDSKVRSGSIEDIGKFNLN